MSCEQVRKIRRDDCDLNGCYVRPYVSEHVPVGSHFLQRNPSVYGACDGCDDGRHYDGFHAEYVPQPESQFRHFRG